MEELSIFVYVIFGILALIDFVLKGMGMWRAARNNQQWWFVVLLMFNTIGILPLLYLLFFQKNVNAHKIKKK